MTPGLQHPDPRGSSYGPSLPFRTLIDNLKGAAQNWERAAPGRKARAVTAARRLPFPLGASSLFGSFVHITPLLVEGQKP